MSICFKNCMWRCLTMGEGWLTCSARQVGVFLARIVFLFALFVSVAGKLSMIRLRLTTIVDLVINLDTHL